MLGDKLGYRVVVVEWGAHGYSVPSGLVSLWNWQFVNFLLYQEQLLVIHFIADPPDVPSEVTCAIYEYSDNMTCTWDAGKPTYIDTKYVVHVKR